MQWANVFLEKRQDNDPQQDKDPNHNSKSTTDYLKSDDPHSPPT